MKCPYCDIEIPLNELSYRRLENHLKTHADSILEAANRLADARVRYAREYARIRLLNPEWTDKRCLLAATEETNDETTRLEAELEVARRTT